MSDDKNILQRGATWTGLSLLLTAVVGFVGMKLSFWSATEFIPWALIANAVIALLASRGRLLTVIRSIEAVGTKIELMSNSVDRQEDKLKGIEDKITNIQQQRVAIHQSFGTTASEVLQAAASPYSLPTSAQKASGSTPEKKVSEGIISFDAEKKEEPPIFYKPSYILQPTRRLEK